MHAMQAVHRSRWVGCPAARPALPSSDSSRGQHGRRVRRAIAAAAHFLRGSAHWRGLAGGHSGGGRGAAGRRTCEARHSRFRKTFSATSQRGRRRRHLPAPPTPCSARSRPATAGSCIHFSSLFQAARLEVESEYSLVPTARGGGRRGRTSVASSVARGSVGGGFSGVCGLPVQAAQRLG